MRFGLVLAALMALGYASCQEAPASAEARSAARKHSLPSSNGTHNELTIFCDRALWEDDLGILLLDQLAKPMDGLPMAEAHFDLSRIDQNAVSRLTKRSKSILTLAIIPDSSATLVLENLWAEPQLVVAIIAPNREALKRRVQASLPEVIQRFDAHDAQVLARRIQSSQSATIPASLANLGIQKFVFSKGFKTTLSKPGLAILREDTRKSIQYLLAWEQAWDGESDPSQSILEAQNDLLVRYFEGSQDGSHLAIEPRIPVVQSYEEIGGGFVYLSRGQFRTEGGFGGGPFVTYSYIDEPHDRIVNMCYLVYAPSMKKRKVMMELESSLRSLRLR
ncbi:DUF4837 family protein [Schleiferiaceae bacterium]|jgi:hypothetical protein|nr:DUF4837 family protein [Schleiferiaceae bacterium]